MERRDKPTTTNPSSVTGFATGTGILSMQLEVFMFLNVGGVKCPAKAEPLWFHKKGLSQTASGYGRRLTAPWKVFYNNKWRRVYCCLFSNSGTCYIDGPKGPDGKKPRIVVTD